MIKCSDCKYLNKKMAWPKEIFIGKCEITLPPMYTLNNGCEIGIYLGQVTDKYGCVLGEKNTQ